MQLLKKFKKLVLAIAACTALTAVGQESDDFYPPLDTELNDFDPTVAVGRYIQAVSSNTVETIVVLTNDVLTVGTNSVDLATPALLDKYALIEKITSIVTNTVTGKITTNFTQVAYLDDIPFDGFKEIAYADLINLLNIGHLKPRQQYAITNYVTYAVQSYSATANHYFDVIVTADSTNSLNAVARARESARDVSSYFTSNGSDPSKWELKYDIENSTAKYAWADSTTGTGVIYWMKDEWGNECPYDFKNIKFLAYGDTNNVFRYTFDSGAASGNTDSSLQGFSNGVRNNTIKAFFQTEYRLPFIVFKGTGCFNNTFDVNCSNITFEDHCNDNTFGRNCAYITFGNSCYKNTLGDSCSYNSFLPSCYQNTFGVNCSHNTLASVCGNNTFGKNCHGQQLANVSNGNVFGNDCTGNEVGEWSGANIFGNECSGNVVGPNCKANTFHTNTRWNSLAYGCDYNTFHENSYSNSLGSSCAYNTFGKYNYRNSFGNSCEYNTFGGYSRVNVFGASCSSNTFGDNCYKNTFGATSQNNAFGDSCHDNSYGPYFSNNFFASQCYSNTGSDYCQYNTFGNGCNNIRFGNASGVKDRYSYIIVEDGNQYIYIDCQDTSSGYYRNVKIAQGVNNTTTWKTITDYNVGQTFQTVIKPANSIEVSVDTNETSVVIGQ